MNCKQANELVEALAAAERNLAIAHDFIKTTQHGARCHLQKDRPFSERARAVFDAKGCDCGRDAALAATERKETK